MQFGYCIGKNIVGKIVFSTNKITLEDFMQNQNISNSQEVIVSNDKTFAEYLYKYFLVNRPDISKTLLRSLYEKQNSINEMFKANKPIKKEVEGQITLSIAEENTNTNAFPVTPSIRIPLAEAEVNQILNGHEEFLLGGKAKFTIKNELTGNRFTFFVKKAKKRNQNQASQYYFVSVLTGTNNDKNYTYMGMLKIENNIRTFYQTEKVKITKDAQSVKTFSWLIKNIANLPSNIKFYHEGFCARCGRTLTVPESIRTGFGPECQRIRSKNINKNNSVKI